MKNHYKNIEELFEKGLIWQAESSVQKANSFLAKPNTRAFPLARFSIPEIDSALPQQGLASGCLHEFTLENAWTSKTKKIWHPPFFIVGYLLSNAFYLNAPEHKKNLEQSETKFIAWIGEKVWPTPHLFKKLAALHQSQAKSGLAEDPLLENSLFIETKTKKEKLLAMAQTLRAPSVFAVIGDASGLNFAQTRSLQQSAKEGQTLCFLLRPPWELVKTSAAHTRWKLHTLCAENSIDAEDNALNWELTLINAKGSINLLDSVDVPRELYWPRSWQIAWKEENENGANTLGLFSKSKGQDTTGALALSAA